MQLKPVTVVLAVLAGLSIAPQVLSQTRPDSGQMLQELHKPAKPSPPPTGLTIKPGLVEKPTPAGGPTATVTSVNLQGVSRFNSATLLAVLGNYRGKSYDLAGMKGLADRITRYYRDHGYPFALAYLPPQKVVKGRLLIKVIEGRYGKVTVSGDPKLAQGARRFLSGLHTGDVIRGKPLQRSVYLLGDQPGIRIYPVLSPGSAVGSGDLDVKVTPGKRYTGEIGFDNYGNRYTGRWRANASVAVNRVLVFGDQLTVSGLASNDHLLNGQLGYSLPLGGSGLRGLAGYQYGDYKLGDEFSALGLTGRAEVGTVGLEYPLVRSLRSNLSIQTVYRYKSLRDEYAVGAPRDKRTSDTVQLTLRFDHRDAWLGGGLTWGDLAWTTGQLNLDSGFKAIDAVTAKTDGHFDKVNLELARLQHLVGPLSFFTRVMGQWTGDNLDSSESFGLGGADGVRAYPEGEGYGDRGGLVQLELRYRIKFVSPYLFYDAGKIEINADPWASGNNHRTIAGGGIGVRSAVDGLDVDASLAWRTVGGPPLSDTRNDNMRFWLSVIYRL